MKKKSIHASSVAFVHLVVGSAIALPCILLVLRNLFEK